MYTSLNDAVIYDARLDEGDYKIYFVDGYTDSDFCNNIIRHIKCLGISHENKDDLSKQILENTLINKLYHTHLGSIKGDEDLENLFVSLQGEMWSPMGEARDLIRSKGLNHTSMSVGDLIETPAGDLYVVGSFGFEKLN